MKNVIKRDYTAYIAKTLASLGSAVEIWQRLMFFRKVSSSNHFADVLGYYRKTNSHRQPINTSRMHDCRVVSKVQ